jgi:hypothetical protein
MQLYYDNVFVLINNFARGKPVFCWNYLYTWPLYHGFSKESYCMSVIFYQINYITKHSKNLVA